MKLKHDGVWEWGIYGLGMGHLWLKSNNSTIYGLSEWGIYGLDGMGHLWESKLLVFWGGDMLEKHWSSGEYPFWSLHDHVSVPLNSRLLNIL